MTVRVVGFVAHLDFDAFFASVEMRLRPALARRPVVVAGSGPRSVVAAASYPARAFGVRSGQPLFEARSRCRDLVVVEPRFAAYRMVSGRAFGLVEPLVDVLEVVGLDEAFVRVGDEAVPVVAGLSAGEPAGPVGPVARVAADDPGGPVGSSPELWAAALRSVVRTELGLPLSVGVASSKVAAKLASMAAKPDGVRVVERSAEPAFLSLVDLGSVPGVGPRMLEVLVELGLRTVGDVRSVDRKVLVSRLGRRAAEWLGDLAEGVDERPVVRASRRLQVGVSRTFDRDLLIGEVPFDVLLVEGLQRLAADGRAAASVTVRFVAVSGEGSMSSRLPSPTRDAGVLAAAARGLFGRLPSGPLRLVGVSFSALSDSEQLVLPEFGPGLVFAVPEVPAPRLVECAYYLMPVRHPVHGVGRLQAVLDDGGPVIDERALCRVLFDRPRLIEASRLEPVLL